VRAVRGRRLWGACTDPGAILRRGPPAAKAFEYSIRAGPESVFPRVLAPGKRLPEVLLCDSPRRGDGGMGVMFPASKTVGRECGEAASRTGLNHRHDRHHLHQRDDASMSRDVQWGAKRRASPLADPRPTRGRDTRDILTAALSAESPH
jgi:hypothetical protein